MFDWFENAPEWCTVVVRWEEKRWTIYLQTDEEGKSGNVLVVPDSAEEGFSTRPKGVKKTGENHIWWGLSNQRQVVARRGVKNFPTPTRYLTEEEAAILFDLGMLEEALEQQGVELAPTAVESYLYINVENSLTGDLEYVFDESCHEDDSAATVKEFFNIIEKVYYKLGFQNKVTVTADCGTYGFTKVFKDNF